MASQKQQLIQLHQLLTEVRLYADEHFDCETSMSALSEYQENGLCSLDMNKNRTDQKDALLLLANGLATAMNPAKETEPEPNTADNTETTDARPERDPEQEPTPTPAEGVTLSTPQSKTPAISDYTESGGQKAGATSLGPTGTEQADPTVICATPTISTDTETELTTRTVPEVIDEHPPQEGEKSDSDVDVDVDVTVISNTEFKHDTPDTELVETELSDYSDGRTDPAQTTLIQPLSDEANQLAKNIDTSTVDPRSHSSSTQPPMATEKTDIRSFTKQSK